MALFVHAAAAASFRVGARWNDSTGMVGQGRGHAQLERFRARKRAPSTHARNATRIATRNAAATLASVAMGEKTTAESRACQNRTTTASSSSSSTSQPLPTSAHNKIIGFESIAFFVCCFSLCVRNIVGCGRVFCAVANACHLLTRYCKTDLSAGDMTRGDMITIMCAERQRR